MLFDHDKALWIVWLMKVSTIPWISCCHCNAKNKKSAQINQLHFFPTFRASFCCSEQEASVSLIMSRSNSSRYIIDLNDMLNRYWLYILPSFCCFFLENFFLQFVNDESFFWITQLTQINNFELSFWSKLSFNRHDSNQTRWQVLIRGKKLNCIWWC